MPYNRSFLIHIARLALHTSLNSRDTAELWHRVWDAARRAMTAVSTSRAACHLLSVLLEAGVMTTNMSANLLETTLFGGGINGPSSLTDTSLVLMTNILRSKIFDNDRHFEALCLKIIGWLDLRWTLRKLISLLSRTY